MTFLSVPSSHLRLNIAPFGRWTLRRGAAHRQLFLRWAGGEITLRFAQCVVLLGIVASNAMAGQVPGTSVSITPPNGYVATDRFPGFMNEATGSSIMVSEIPGPYSEVTAGFNDKKRMQAQGMSLLGKSSVKLNGYTGMLLHVEQPAYGTLFNKWMVAVDRSGTTTLIVATYPEAAAK